MKDLVKIRTALISVFHKENLDRILELLVGFDVKLISTGGTKSYIEEKAYSVESIENLTDYPSILGGRVKTLHPKIFGGILARRQNESDLKQLEEYKINEIDLVIVDLYPFEETLASGANDESVIEKIDIGGISLIRAGAKNFNDVLIISGRHQYEKLITLLEKGKGISSLADRKKFAAEAFHVSSHYDSAIFNYFNSENEVNALKISENEGSVLRYGENPHQKGYFFGDLDSVFEKLHGKEISYNNILDIDAAVNLISDFNETTFAILKHNNACGLASRPQLADAWKDALAGDPVSAFGGVLITNQEINKETAAEINKIFFEAILAPAYTQEVLEILKQKKNRIILVLKKPKLPQKIYRSALNGILVQDKDLKTDREADMKTVTKNAPSDAEISDMEFANKLVKHTKSNAIVLAKNKQLLASGLGQTSRVDALQQAIQKAKHFNFDLEGAVMASDAFFPFADSVEIAEKEGILAVIQPGGSIRDQESIDYCDQHQMSMVFTGTRHFKH